MEIKALHMNLEATVMYLLSYSAKEIMAIIQDCTYKSFRNHQELNLWRSKDILSQALRAI